MWTAAIGVAVTVSLGLLVNELFSWAPRWADRLIMIAASCLPREQERWYEEWRAEVEACPGHLWKLRFAIPIFVVSTWPTFCEVLRRTNTSPAARRRWVTLWARMFYLYAGLTPLIILLSVAGVPPPVLPFLHPSDPWAHGFVDGATTTLNLAFILLATVMFVKTREERKLLREKQYARRHLRS